MRCDVCREPGVCEEDQPPTGWDRAPKIWGLGGCRCSLLCVPRRNVVRCPSCGAGVVAEILLLSRTHWGWVGVTAIGWCPQVHPESELVTGVLRQQRDWELWGTAAASMRG